MVFDKREDCDGDGDVIGGRWVLMVWLRIELRGMDVGVGVEKWICGEMGGIYGEWSLGMFDCFGLMGLVMVIVDVDLNHELDGVNYDFLFRFTCYIC